MFPLAVSSNSRIKMVAAAFLAEAVPRNLRLNKKEALQSHS